MSDSDTPTRILDCAEEMFARDGFHNTSLRGLTARAEVNLAAVNYHFGSKEALLEAVIERRLLPLNRIRRDKIAAVLAAAGQQQTPPSVRALLQAFVAPTLEFRNSSPGARAFIALIGRSLSEPDATVRQCFMERVMPLFQYLLQALGSALPHLPPAILLTRLHFVIGSMSHVMCSGEQANSAGELLEIPLAKEELIEQLLTFVCAGLETPR
jgi:AcrR family transcriptional regulator